ncbi:two component transcriptional regulator, LuxR family [Fodinibius roseus]|uniref:Two component transcriptional regulator, LuxR family n=1 Tax=Fodinibius roseus TaxID=1194090 RepID=A0A1M5ED40_9BACT|nr:response regulator transcription factor [Fodinibius roseus]SHF77115.1 two component transcriptional regulator, LuxR family [Fodinibius roseus]
MIKVIITDDHPLIREGIKNVIQGENDIEVIGEAQNGQEVMELLRKEIPHILLLDITMPGKNGLDLLKQINELYPNMRVLMLSNHPEKRFAVRALKAGAYGYLNKLSYSDELIKAIRRITSQNRKYITDDVAEQLASQVDITNGSLVHEKLSDREFQVLCMIASGQSVSEIAEEFSLSPQTIHTYRTRIKEKMNLDSNVEMTRYAIENDLIDK